MKIKIRTDRQTGEMSAEYFSVADKTRFRLHLLQKVLEGADSAVLMVDTNQHVTEASEEAVLSALKGCGIEPLVMPIAANPQRIFGISYSPRNSKALEKIILIELSDGAVPGEDALTALLQYDVAVGIRPGKTLQDTGNLLCIGTPIYGSGLFEQEMYDSILCAVVRSSFDISRFVKEIQDEMGI